MYERKLVSAITGTYNRHELVLDTIENLVASTYRPLEHIIVSDGIDPFLYAKLENELLPYANGPAQWNYQGVQIKYAECGRRWSTFLAASISTIPFQVAQWMASGDYLMWLSDDERMTPDHITKLVHLLETGNNDFVYSLCRIYFSEEIQAQQKHRLMPRIIGAKPPFCGSVTNVLYRAQLLDYRGFEPHIGSGTDWDQVNHWIEAGARYDMLNEITYEHRVDKLGEGPLYTTQRQPLLGNTVSVV